MIRNRFFKGTIGKPAEVIIAQSLDASNSPSAGTAATSVNTVTIAGTPTLGDSITFNIGGYIYTYTVPSGVTTAAQAVTGIEAMLDANTQGFTAASSGTTSATFTLTGPVGTSFNGVTVTGSETGSTFSSIVTANFAGGVNPVLGFQTTLEDFVDNADDGAIAAYWEDTKAAVAYGTTTLPANVGRKYFFAWKQADGVVKITTPIPVPVPATDKVSIAYAAGQGDIYTLAFGGTIAVTQILHVRIIDKTSTEVPYPSWEYQETVTSTVAAAVTALAADINAEKIDKIFSASDSSTTLTITGTDTTRVLDVSAYIETSPSQTVDASNIVKTHTQKAIAPVGTYADVKWLESFFQVQQGLTLYSQEGTLPSDFGEPASNVLPSIQYGYVIIKSFRKEQGATRNYEQPLYTIIALPTASRASLIGL